jgi:predicted transcriptional regulator of viral defense system
VNAREALGRLRALRVPAVTTADAAALLDISVEAASHTLRRLGASGLVTPVRKGLWAIADRPDPLTLAEHVTAPYPSYVSLQSALYLHGMIDQIPAVTYLVSLARSARVRTGVGTFSIHHVRPELFGGAERDPTSGVRLASREKALVDYLYLSPTRTRLFAALPELELPKSFDPREARRWVARIPAGRLRTIVERELERVLQAERPALRAAGASLARRRPRA